MNTRTLVAAVVAAALAGCASTPMNRDLLHQHAERNCRVRSAVSPAYDLDSAGIGTRNVAYARCLRVAGSGARGTATPSRAA